MLRIPWLWLGLFSHLVAYLVDPVSGTLFATIAAVCCLGTLGFEVVSPQQIDPLHVSLSLGAMYSFHHFLFP